MPNLDLKPRTLHFGNPTMPYPSAGLAQAEADFRRRYPQYEQTAKLDELRATDYARLDTQAHVYLDYTGGSLYAESQLRDHMALLN
jgi:molybdenum cofactor sulfurtransferase